MTVINPGYFFAVIWHGIGQKWAARWPFRARITTCLFALCPSTICIGLRPTILISRLKAGPWTISFFILMRAEKVTLGMDLAARHRRVVAVPSGCWKALRLHDGASYALMANTLSPEFTPDRVKIGAGAEWVKRYANSAPWATPQALRELIGPNFTAQ